MSDIMDSDLETDLLDESFMQAADRIQSTHTKYMPDDLLELYALYKQATIGRCKTSKPGILSLQARSKWCAWNDLRDMTSAEAKRLYVIKVQKLDPIWDQKIRSGTKKQSMPYNWVVHSAEIPPDDPIAEHEKTAFDYVKEGNLERLRASLITPQLLNQLDEFGMGLIHWASDRNAADILRFLLEAGADVNLRDADRQTALHYAASCAHLEILRILLNSRADRFAKDAEGQTSLDVAEDDQVRSLLEI